MTKPVRGGMDLCRSIFADCGWSAPGSLQLLYQNCIHGCIECYADVRSDEYEGTQWSGVIGPCLARAQPETSSVW